MGDSSKNPGENDCKNAHVAENGSIDDIGDIMQCAQLPGVLYAELKIERISRKSAADGPTTFFDRLIWPVARAVFAFQLRRLARDMEHDVEKSEETWRRVLGLVRKQEGWNVCPSLGLEYVEAGRGMKQHFDRMEARLDVLKKHFPDVSGRICVSINRLRQINCDYIPKLFRDDNPAMVASAQRHYEDGTLMTVETFVNGLQGR